MPIEVGGNYFARIALATLPPIRYSPRRLKVYDFSTQTAVMMSNLLRPSTGEQTMQLGLMRYKVLVGAVLLTLGLANVVGCKSGLETVAMMFGDTDEGAAYTGLKGKRVVVVCRALAGLEFRNASAARELAKKVSVLLKKEKASKIDMVDAQKVASWIDDKNEDDPAKVGRAMKADRVVVVDLTAPIELYDGVTLYRGKTTVSLSVYDLEIKKTDFEQSIQCEYPPSTGIPTSDKTEAQFRSEFLEYVAAKIVRNLCSHDPNVDIGLDAAAGLH